MTNSLLTTRQGAVMTVTMNRPDQLNILGEPGDGDAFRKVFADMNEDRTIKCVIFTGAGRAFSAGGNVKDMRERTGMFSGDPMDQAEAYRKGIQRIPRAIYSLNVPIIAAVNGPAVGAGCDLATMCDIRIASSKAMFAESFANQFSADCVRIMKNFFKKKKQNVL